MAELGFAPKVVDDTASIAALFDSFDPDGSGMIDYRELAGQLRPSTVSRNRVKLRLKPGGRQGDVPGLQPPTKLLSPSKQAGSVAAQLSKLLRDANARVRLDAALAGGHPLVVDGDALHLLGDHRSDAAMIVTPHAGEFSAMFGDTGGSKIARATDAARRSGAVVVFKGADTVIAAPDGQAVVHPDGTAWLATAGTGDVLTGIIGARLAASTQAFDAAVQGVWLHAEAARRAGRSFIADDLADRLPAAIGACL